MRAKRNLLLQISRSPTYLFSNSFDPGSPSCKAAAAPMFMIVIKPFLCVCEEGLWELPQGLYYTYVSFQLLDILKNSVTSEREFKSPAFRALLAFFCGRCFLRDVVIGRTSRVFIGNQMSIHLVAMFFQGVRCCHRMKTEGSVIKERFKKNMLLLCVYWF